MKLAYCGAFSEMLTLDNLRESYQADQLTVVRRGNRLSILPVDTEIAMDLLKRLGPLQ